MYIHDENDNDIHLEKCSHLEENLSFSYQKYSEYRRATAIKLDYARQLIVSINKECTLLTNSHIG